jgi:hypothetical protein
VNSLSVNCRSGWNAEWLTAGHTGRGHQVAVAALPASEALCQNGWAISSSALPIADGCASRQMSIDVDRSREVTFGRVARKSAPMLMPHTLTGRMTVKLFDMANSAIQTNGLEGSLLIEWE